MCREHAAQVRGEYENITAAGVGVTAIGTGDARYAQAFVAAHDIPFLVLLDGDAAAAGIAQVRRGVATVSGPGSWIGAAKALRGGHRQGRTGPRPTQQGATFVVDRGGALLYGHLDAHPGDHAPLPDVLAAAGVS